MKTWEQTQLWREITRRASDSSESTVIQANLAHPNCMARIATILAQGETAPADFTLHDEQHSFRVAERIIEILPENSLNSLSTIELALLLLSAYLHDIGMTPNLFKVENFWTHLVTGESTLDSEEKSDFQKWLDQYGYNVKPPLCKEAPTPQDLNLAKEVITYYCRSKHNDWGAEWTKANINLQFTDYPEALDDLITICKSHHYDYDELIQPNFDPKPVGPTDIVNVRYLALLLRVADILENDPERTPEVLIKHRKISPSSLIYWYKDHSFNLRIENDDTGRKRVSIYARPPSALLHKAILETVDFIEYELRICTRISEENRFQRFNANELPHKWVLLPYITLNIAPLNENYEYIEGTFKPNTQKLIKLLAGTSLYKDPLAAFGELIQNALDSIKTAIALERLSLWKATGDNSGSFEKKYKIECKLSRIGERYTLTCTDNGIGITKKIFSQYFLTSGSEKSSFAKHLERECENAGFSPETTGQFGIGVLSYFMLAEKIEIYSRRSDLAPDTEPYGWHFEIDGIGEFGELKRDYQHPQGSTVILHLREEFQEPIDSFLSNSLNYISEKITHLPCHFSFTHDSQEYIEYDLKPGWSYQEKPYGFSRLLISPLIHKPKRETSMILPETEEKKRESDFQKKTRRFQKLKSSLKWKIFTGEIPNRIGRYQLELPYFETKNGFSLTFPPLQPSEKEYEEEVVATGCDTRLNYSLKGMTISKSSNSYSPFYKDEIEEKILFPGILTIDITESSLIELSINRENFSIKTEIFNEGLLELFSTLSKEIATFLRSNPTEYLSLDLRILREDEGEDPQYWAKKGKKRIHWGEITYPLTLIKKRELLEQYEFREKALTKVHLIKYDTNKTFSPFLNGPIYCVPLENEMHTLVPVWTQEKPIKHEIGASAAFPPTWEILLGAQSIHNYYFNKNNQLVKIVDLPFKTISEMVSQLASEEMEDQLLQDKVKAATLILGLIKGNHKMEWEGLLEKRQEFIAKIWNLVSLPDSIVNIQRIDYTLTALQVSPTSWNELSYYSPAFKSLLDKPSADWVIKKCTQN